MNIKEQIDKDLKNALLAGDKKSATTLRGLKSAILYAEVDKGQREAGLSDREIIVVLRKEGKKRQESAELYKKGGNLEKAEAELEELALLSSYLPAATSDQQLEEAVDKAVEEVGELSGKTLGRVIARTKELTDGGAEGGRIAEAVKRRLGS